MNRALIVIFDAEGNRHYSIYVLAPEGMDRHSARDRVDEVILAVKDADPDEYEASQLEEALKKEGFIFPETIFAREDW